MQTPLCLCGSGDVGFPKVHHGSLPFLSSYQLFTRVPQLCLQLSSTCVCVAVVESVAGMQRRRVCRHKHWRGLLSCHEAITQSTTLLCLAPLSVLTLGKKCSSDISTRAVSPKRGTEVGQLMSCHGNTHVEPIGC